MTPEQELELRSAIADLLSQADRFVPATEALTNTDLAQYKLRLWAGPNLGPQLDRLRAALQSIQ